MGAHGKPSGSLNSLLVKVYRLIDEGKWDDQGTGHVRIDYPEEFNKKSNSLYTILRSSRLAGSQRAPFLRQFLMRLNFNSFFEQTARGVLNVVKARPAIPFVQQE